MRASQWLLGLATVSAIVGAVAAGCGGSTNNNGPTDAATDVTTDHVEAAAPEAAPEAAPQDAPSEACPVDADVTWPTIPDAALGDSGSTTEACLACVQAACPQLISECNASCACKEAFGAFETCAAAPGASIITCGEGLATNGGLPLTDLACAVSCANTCGVTLPSDGGGEGGGDSGGDGPGE